MLETAFYEVAAIMLIAGLVAFLGVFLKQPLIVSFIAAGILVGPAGFGLARTTEFIELLSELGVSLLLFVVGLRLDLRLIQTTGRVALLTGLGQVAFTSVIGFFICQALGLSVLTSIYVAVALTFSSTIIIVKLLSDKGELDALHGRIALGFLIVQDMVVVLVMIALSAYGVGAVATDNLAVTIGLMVAKGAAFLGGLALFMRYGARPVLERLAQTQELLVLLSVAYAVALAALSDWLGFSKEMGAFLAGISLASTAYREIISARLMSLRDFLLLFFFIALGTHLDISITDAQVPAAILLSLFVLIGNPLIVMVIMGAMGYRKRTSFLAGLAVAQISEFSLIFAALGLSLGHIDQETMGLVTLVGIITIAISTYMILYSQPLYAWLEPVLWPFERRVVTEEEAPAAAGRRYDAIVFGLGRFGTNIAQGLRRNEMKVLGVDFDPQAVKRWSDWGHDAVYGDARDPSFLDNLPLRPRQCVIVTIPIGRAPLTDAEPALTLVKALRQRRFQGSIAAAARDRSDVPQLRQAGADIVLLPFVDAARRAVEEIVEAFDEARPPAPKRRKRSADRELSGA